MTTSLPTSANFVVRYLSGDHTAWDDILKSAPTQADDPEFLTQAAKVVELIMHRVRRNVATVRETLIKSGAKLGNTGAPLDPSALAPLTQRFGPLPLSLETFYRVVGPVQLTPLTNYCYGKVALEELDSISLIALDPLEVSSIFQSLIEEYDESPSTPDAPRRPFELVLSPDFLHKQNISGGEPYSIQLPPQTAMDKLDPKVLHERHDLSFVNYLRHCFSWGGFPGLDVTEQAQENIPTNWRLAFKNVQGNWQPATQRLRQALCQNLEAF